MLDEKPLYLYEELMLLALRDKKGTIAADGTAFAYTLAAAIISELMLSGHLKVDRVRKNKIMLDLKKSTRVRDPILDESVEKIKNAKRRGSIQTWVMRLAGLKKLRHRAALQLCKRGILKDDEEKILLFFTRKIYPEIDSRPEKELIARLRKAIFAKDRDIEPRTAVLVAVADKAKVLRNVFDPADLKKQKARIKQITAGDLTAAATQEVIDGVNAAIMVAVMIPAITATTPASC